MRAETKGRDDAVVEDVGDVGLRGEAAQGGCILVVSGGLDGDDSQMLVAVHETSAGGCDPGFGIAGDDGVAIEDEIAVGSDAGGIDLGGGDAAEKEQEDEGVSGERSGSRSNNGHTKSRRTGSQVMVKGHTAPRCFAEVRNRLSGNLYEDKPRCVLLLWFC